MTDIIEMARQAGCEIRNGHIYNQHIGSLDQMLKRFAKLVAAKEREACLKIAESMSLDENMITELQERQE